MYKATLPFAGAKDKDGKRETYAVGDKVENDADLEIGKKMMRVEEVADERATIAAAIKSGKPSKGGEA